MKESILHYVWQYKLFNTHELRTTDGEAVSVIDVGQHNTDAGPDFFNAKIRIGETLWAGNIEIHVLSSDWKRHGHHFNKAYDNVILHVVAVADTEVIRCDGEKISQLILNFSPKIEENYDSLLAQKKWIACADRISSIPRIFVQSWKVALLTERLNSKVEAIEYLLEENNQHWEEAFYITIARNFGFGINSQAFEALAKSLPLSILAKHKNELFQIEALLLGQANLLSDEINDAYFSQLNKEYQFLQSKYQLTPISAVQWKFLRLRPDNFPHIKIAQFAALIHHSSKLFSKIIENPEIEYLQSLFGCQPSEYWHTHYRFGKKSNQKMKTLGALSVNGILINSVIPYLFCYAQHQGHQELKDTALQLLEQIPSERNSIIVKWEELGLKSTSAYDSQAFIQLKKEYCDEKKCLRCRIGHKVMSMQID